MLDAFYGPGHIPFQGAGVTAGAAPFLIPGAAFLVCPVSSGWTSSGDGAEKRLDPVLGTHKIDQTPTAEISALWIRLVYVL